MGIEGSTTSTIAIAAATSDLHYRLTLRTGAVDIFTGATAVSVNSWEDLSADFAVRRGVLQFVHPATPTSNDDSFLLDPIVIAAVSLTFLTTGVYNGSPKASVYVARASSVALDDTHWPGPPTLAGGGVTAPVVTATHEWLNAMPQGNDGVRASVAITEATTQTITLDPTQLRRIVQDDAGQALWDGKYNLCFVVDGELSGYSAATTTGEITAGNATSYFSLENDTTTMSVETVPFHTGFETGREDRTRAVRDQRLGAPAMSADLVQDGYTKSWVNSWDWDPDDYENREPTRGGSERVSDGKGVR